jgi:hypothetical protein
MSEQMRKEFEEFAARKHGVVSLGRVGDYYSCDNVRYDWIVWQASRAAIVVELPKYTPKAHRINATVAGIKIELKKAGVSYK